MALLIRNFLCRLIAHHLLLLAVQICFFFFLLLSLVSRYLLVNRSSPSGKVFALLGGLDQILKKSNIGLDYNMGLGQRVRQIN